VSSIKGTRQLNARLKAIKQTFKLAGRDWAEEAAVIMRSSVPSRTGRLQRSFRVKSATQRRAHVGGHYSAFFVDRGTKAHTINAKRAPRLIFQAGGRTIFAKKVNHPATRAQPFRHRAATEALRRRPMAATLIKLWNKAA
jgi:hypothetical protein